MSELSWGLITLSTVVLKDVGIKLGRVAHTSNPSYLGGRDRGSQFEGSLGKELTTHFKNKPGAMVHACNPSYSGGRGRKIIVQGQSEQS
jgi:hypothetical protein